MPPTPKPVQKDLDALIDLSKTTLTLLAHFQSSLAPSSVTQTSQDPAADFSNPLETIKAGATLLRSHVTTLSLLLVTPPLTPSALISKIGDVSSGPLTALVATAVVVPLKGKTDEVGELMKGEIKAMMRRVLSGWGQVITLVLRQAEKRKEAKSKAKDNGPTESEKEEVFAATGVVWDACDALLSLCAGGVVALVVKKAEELRSVLLDAVEELKEWGEDIEEDDDEAESSGDEDDEFKMEDEIFGAANKLGKDDKELKALLDASVKKAKMIGILYQALIKRRLKTFPASNKAPANASGENGSKDKPPNHIATLEKLMGLLRAIPESVDDLASAFYDLEEDEAKQTLDKLSGEAKSAVALVPHSWSGAEDEFTAWSTKWIAAFDAVPIGPTS